MNIRESRAVTLLLNTLAYYAKGYWVPGASRAREALAEAARLLPEFKTAAKLDAEVVKPPKP